MHRRSYLWTLLCVFIVGLLTPCVHADTPLSSPIVEGFQFKLSSNKNSYSGGDPVYIEVWLKNTTDIALIGLYADQIEERLNVSVTDKKGKSVPLTALGAEGYIKPDFSKPFHKYTGPIRGMGETVLPAHQALHYQILVSRLFDMSKEGSYLITVSQWVPKLSSEGVSTLTSSTLTVDVGRDSNSVLTPTQTNPQQPGRTGFAIGSIF